MSAISAAAARNGRGRGRVVSAVGIAAFGAAATAGAAAAAGTALVRADRRRASEVTWDELAVPEESVHHEVQTSDGGLIHAVEHGDSSGRPIVLLHGVTLTHGIWPYQLRSLAAAGHRVIALDQRSHGESKSGSRGPTLEAMADDVADVLEQLDLRGAVLVGHSMGSMVTINFTDSHRELVGKKGRVAAIALIGAGPCVPQATRRLTTGIGVFELGTKALDSRQMTLLPGGDVGYLMARFAFGAKPDPHHVALTRNLSGAMSPHRFGELFPNVIKFDGRRLLSRVDVPALVTVAPLDRLLFASLHRYLLTNIPGARGLELPGCGHMPMLERHAEVDAALIELAASLAPVRRGRGSSKSHE
jgi:pimeloyl-ACP methyl ester carboxylesterase